MKKACFLLLLTWGISITAFSQEFLWKTDVYSFFDNTEFSGSEVQNDQTMAGIHLAPQIGLNWNKRHRIFAGVDLLHDFASDEAIDEYKPIVYYEFQGKMLQFYMGAVPRKNLLDKYPRMFFQDSITNYRPTINGFFWELNKNKHYANVWLDWTGKQSKDTNEAFFMGWSGRYNYKLLYAQHFGYMFHYALKKDADINESVHDNGLVLTSIGLDFSKLTGFEQLEINAGWSVGLDRDRNIGEWNTPQGFLSETKIEYKGIGLFNTLYLGESQQIFHKDHSSKLYWGDSFYRLKKYNRTDFDIHFIKSQVVNIKFTCSLHFAESKVYGQQIFNVSFNLNNLPKQQQKKYEYLWDDWF
ncbi:hypothetical protein LJB98_03605 [Bacteroidales bacterium OttesenSCG-928-M11]|nr:hypothetical protein [Bacteroidales bacterium OttesenSCG-928-M11]